MATTIPAPLAGKVAIITGGSRGIGEAVALDFARKGCTSIAITYHTDRTAAEKVLESIRSVNSSIKTTAFAADVCDPKCGKHVVSRAMKDLQTDRIDILVCNAGIQSANTLRPAREVTKEDVDLFMCAQAWTPLFLAQEVYPHMPRGGRIVMCSSGASKKAYGDPMLLQAMSKAAMDAVARNLGAQFGKDKGITVNSIGVGSTDTESLRDVMGQHEKLRSRMENNSVLERIGTVEEVASIISFVCSPEASWLCSNQIPANGGSVPEAIEVVEDAPILSPLSISYLQSLRSIT
ncbi:hypothetical protein G7Y89_g14404 [Cudoniella acicularis]|uniref:Uncharacterized protein n=1 Tax=Cudoniella acicularis TaxID=354080 RepID=A0A8H4R4D5_9HELO|nr:hypothetical protein G7Y89_g14404 [Cudoniella acicularis]